MRCDCCPLWPVNGEYNDNTCPEMDGPMGLEHKDGVSGCRHPWNWVEKREREYYNYLGEMAENIRKWMKENEKGVKHGRDRLD